MAQPSVDVSGRPIVLRTVDWKSLFDPKTVAVVGASETEGTQQRAQWIQVRDRLGARGARVVPIHPTRETILGTPALRSVLDVDGPIDLAIILVRDPIPVLEECVEKGVGTAVIFAAGFSEVGTDEGREAQVRLKELASGAVRVMGPNTNLNIFEPWQEGLPGRKLAIVTQSGHQGRPISQGQTLGIAIQSWATIGNEVDLEFADFVAKYAEEPDTGAIAGYVEGFQNGRTLMLAADRATQAGVPIVIIKVGKTDEGRQMAQAHTGHLTGSDAVHDAVFRQCGIIRVDDLDEIIEISGMFCHTTLLPPGSAGGVCIYALSGGTASHMVDLCSDAGLSVPHLEQRTIDGLRQYIPWFLHADNPVDSGGTITALPAGRAVLDLLVEDGNTDILLVPITGVFPGMSDALARDLIELHKQGRKRVIAIWSSPRRDDPAYAALCESGVPLFHSFCAAVRGIKALVDFSAFRASYQSPFTSVPMRLSKAAAPARKLLAGGGARDEVESKALLRFYGIPTVTEHVATSAREALAAAADLGGAVVMKILSADIGHKSDLGLVAVGVDGPSAVRASYRRLMEGATRQAPDARIEGVVVQPMVTGAVAEAILGLSHQPPFGPTLLFGLGGVFVEVFEDVAFRVPPFSRASAEDMVSETRGVRLLAGVRGRPAGDVKALVEVIMRLQRLALEVGDEIAELDINPLMVLPKGQGVVAVDALVVARAGL
ncbi:MAG TPA: acetate--CoA ligase family protein [Acidimicrobiales bacterium]